MLMTCGHRDVGCFQLVQFGGDYSAVVEFRGTTQKFGMCTAPMGDAVLTSISMLRPVRLAHAMSMARDIVGIVCLPRNGKLKSGFGRHCTQSAGIDRK
jgi:hypothetical protein